MGIRRATIISAMAATASAGREAPIGKVLTMLGELQAKVIREGENAHKVFAEFAEFCEDRSRELGHSIKTGKSEVESLQAAISEHEATVAAQNAKVEDLVAAIASNEADLKSATSVRNQEAKDFTLAEQELMSTIDMITRASAILQREMQKGGGAMIQLQNAGNLVKALDTMVQASLISSTDASKLSAFVQQTTDSEDNSMADALDNDAPAAAVYENQSGGILNALQGLQDKAEEMLQSSRKKETEARHNFEMLEQSLNDELKFSNSDMQNAKKLIAGAQEARAQAQGDLGMTSKALAEDVKAKDTMHQDCTSKASDFESETKSRAEELEALKKAKQVIEEVVAGKSFAQLSFMQTGSRSEVPGGARAVRLVRALAKRQHSSDLAMLATRMASVVHGGDSGVFDKVKGLISDMIAKLEKEAGEAASKKTYCDKELTESSAKKELRTDQLRSLDTKLASAAAKSTQLKEQVAAIQKDLADLLRNQAEMDKLRSEEKGLYVTAKAELEQGLQALKMALKVLGEYYADDGDHEKSEGGASGVIALLEVCESDFSRNLADVTAVEEGAVEAYDRDSKENYIEKVSKEGDIKYKTKEATGLDKTAAELRADRDGKDEELSAVVEYLARINAECTVVPMSYAEKSRRREAELEGLKEALEVLDAPALIQKMQSTGRSLRIRRVQ